MKRRSAVQQVPPRPGIDQTRAGVEPRRPGRSLAAAFTLSASLALAGCAGSMPPGDSASAPSSAAEASGMPSNSGGSATSSSDSNTSSNKDSAVPKNLCSPGQECLSLSFSGDFLMHDGLWDQGRADAKATGKGEKGIDFAPLIAEQKPFLAEADLSLCQMETPVSAPEGPFTGYPLFNVPPQILTAAKAAGYDACTTASNHSIDQYAEGAVRTYKSVQKAGLGVTGTNLTEAESREPDIFTAANGVKVAVITGTYGLNGLVPDHTWRVDMIDPSAMITKAKKARAAGADVVIANLHAGDEYASAASAYQQENAHQLVDSGQFDLIYGEHTHSVLPIEKYKGTWIIYGLGNNLTELSPWYEVNNEGIMVNAVLAKKGGKWGVSVLRWAPSLIVQNPDYRWCPVTGGKGNGCAPDDAAAQTYARTKATVNAMGADKAGAVEWVPGQK